MKRVLLAGIVLNVFLSFTICAQTFVGDLHLTSQEQIDNFNYSLIQGNLYINDSIDGNITNLDALSTFRQVQRCSGNPPDGNTIIEDNKSLMNVDGLSNLNFVGGYFWITQNPESTVKKL